MTMPVSELYRSADGPIPAEFALHPQKMNRLFDDGYYPTQHGDAEYGPTFS